MIYMRKLLVLLLVILTLTGCAAPIGTAAGPEWDMITIEGVEYIKVDAAPAEYDIHSGSDKGDHLGIIKSGDKTLHVYSIEGDENYLYVRWEWEGTIYVRKDYAGA